MIYVLMRFNTKLYQCEKYTITNSFCTIKS